jgi:hypothetical protein
MDTPFDQYGAVGLAGDLTGLHRHRLVAKLEGLSDGGHWLFLEI